jgi:hypothetical protein
MAAFEDYTSLDIVAWQGVAGDEGSGVTLRAFSLKPPRIRIPINQAQTPVGGRIFNRDLTEDTIRIPVDSGG